MSSFLLVIVGVLHVFGKCEGVPLENPGEDLTKYFSNRIVGGQEAPEAYAPHMAALVVDGVVTIFVCGGSLVTTKLVMTAAHCIEIFVVWGELLPTYHAVIGSNNWFKGGHIAEFSGFDIHPQWNNTNIKYDVGFLPLKERVQLNNKIETIALSYDWLREDEECVIAGWGRLAVQFKNNNKRGEMNIYQQSPSVCKHHDENLAWGITPFYLQLLYVRSISSDECQRGIREAELIWGPSPPFQPDVEICTFHSYGHGLCNGDSGSPLVSIKSGRQVGIASWGFHCARGYPDISVRISGVKEYIQSFLEENS